MKKGELVKSRRWDWTGRVLGFTANGVKIQWLDGVLKDREALVPKDMLIAVAAAIAITTTAAPPARADGLDEFIEEQRVEEQDEVNVPAPKSPDAVADQQCIEGAMDTGLSEADAEDWCLLR